MIDNNDISENGSCDRELVSLKQKDESYRFLFENIPFGLAVFKDVDEGNAFVFSDSNKFFNEKFQVTQKELVGKRLLEMFPGMDLNGLPESLRRVYSTGVSESIPAKYYKDWSSEGWWQCEIYKLPNGEVAAIFNDVTAPKVAENELANSEARWRFALEGASEGVWDSNLATSEAYYSPRWKSMLGYEEHEIANSFAEWETRLHPEDRVRCLAEVERHLRGDALFYESECRLRCKDGSYKWILARGKVVKWTEDGKPLQAVGTHTDITERKRILESLTQSEEKLRTIADYTHDWEYWIDPEGKLVYVSPSCERITGYTAQEFMHYPGLLSTIVHPDDFSIACNHFEISQNDDDRSIQFRIVKRSGEVRWLSHFCRPVFGQDGTWLGRRASNHDITYEKEMAQALIENERRLLHAGKLESLAVMAGGIAHDFNNQLMALLGNLELALDDAPVGAKIRKRIENAILATDKLTALTHQMLAYTGQKYYRSDDLKLDEIIKDQMDSIRPDTPDNVTINIRDDIDAPMIRGDEDQIRRVLINLVTNAIEAIGDGIGQVNVSSGMMYCDRESLNQSLLQDKPAPGQFAFLQVDDNGCGMDEATRSKIFDPFFSTKFWGRGLGMPEMMGIVRSHKGAIFLNSRPDVGTTVRVIFPLPVDATPIAVDGIDHTEAQTQVSGDTQRQKTILVVEDEAEVRELCIELLQIFGYNTLSAEDGDEGVKKFRQHQKTIDLVLLDLMMPQMDGFEAFSQLVQIKPDVKVVISSGYTKEALVNKFQGVSPAGFLHKPYQMDRLLEELEKALGEPG